MLAPPDTITYYFWTLSDWAYLGHARLVAMAEAHGVAIDYRTVDLPAVYAQTGGILLGQRSRQRQDYRMAELRRFKARLADPIVMEPRHFPTGYHAASRLVVAAKRAGLPLGGLTLAIFRATWVEERDIADPAVLRSIAAAHADDPDGLMAAAETPETQAEYDRYTAEAPGDGVFGSPFYFYDGDVLWGQDRLDFLEEALARRAAARAA